MIAQIPSLVQQYPTYASFAGTTVQEIFSSEQLGSAAHLQVTELRSMAFINDGQGHFSTQPLPMEAQLTPLYALHAADISGDGALELLLGGNLYEAKPEVGRYDASFGIVLTDVSQSVSWEQSGFWIDGAARAMVSLQTPMQHLIIVAMNNDSLQVFSHAP